MVDGRWALGQKKGALAMLIGLSVATIMVKAHTDERQTSLTNKRCDIHGSFGRIKHGFPPTTKCRTVAGCINCLPTNRSLQLTVTMPVSKAQQAAHASSDSYNGVSC